MKTYIIISLFTIIVLTAMWNGYVIRWYLTKEDKYSKIWHSIGFIIRALLCAVIYLETGLIYALIAAFVCWLPYNAVINIINHWPLFYVGKTSVIDKLFLKFISKIKEFIIKYNFMKPK